MFAISTILDVYLAMGVIFTLIYLIVLSIFMYVHFEAWVNDYIDYDDECSLFSEETMIQITLAVLFMFAWPMVFYYMINHDVRDVCEKFIELCK